MDIREFDIEIFSLKNGTHSYEFSIDSGFWSHFDYGLISRGTGQADVTLEKSETLIKMELMITGILRLVCDRSLEEFDYSFKTEKTMVFKYGNQEEELGEDVYTINPNTSVINIGQHLYEFIGLEVPLKKLHPRFQQEKDHEQDEIVYRDEERQEQVPYSYDPRWESLRKLKHDN